MTQGALKPFSLLQIGKEADATPGTEVNATARLIGAGWLADKSVVIRPERDYGTLDAAVESPVLVKAESALSFESQLTVQQILYAMNSIDQITPGGAGPYTYSLDSPGATDPDGATYTLEGIAHPGGGNIEQFTVVYGFATNLGISWGVDDLSNMTAEWVARGIVAKAPTADPGLPVRTPIPGALWTVKLADTQAGLAGASALAGVVVSGGMELETCYAPKHRSSGSTDLMERMLKRHRMVITIESELIAAIETERVNFRAGTPRFIRLAAAVNANESIQIDMCGSILEPPSQGEQDEQETRTLVLTSKRDATWAKSWNILVTTNLATIP